MTLQGLNFLAVVVAGAVYFGLGALWYSPLLFANIFMKYRGLTSAEIQGSGQATDYLMALVTDLIAALALAVFLRLANATTFVDGLTVGIVVALGFTATSALKYTIFSGPHKGLWVIYTGYQLVGFAIMGVILALWQ
jgi:RsiW-degrading membrane proteinase PrsW (M82 family)